MLFLAFALACGTPTDTSALQAELDAQSASIQTLQSQLATDEATIATLQTI